MAYFAKIDGNNIVLNITPLAEEFMLDESNVRSEAIGQAYLETHNNWPAAQWIEYSMNTHYNKYYDDYSENVLGDQTKAFRGNGAVIGEEWDVANQIFWKTKPYPSWVKDVPNAKWVSPIGDAPNDLTAEEVAAHTQYFWNEDNTVWEKEIFISNLD
tara:strand:+ start:112 stop:582 length:471 start_codon:yes stop_codon:yes gene_type:complete